VAADSACIASSADHELQGLDVAHAGHVHLRAGVDEEAEAEAVGSAHVEDAPLHDAPVEVEEAPGTAQGVAGPVGADDPGAGVAQGRHESPPEPLELAGREDPHRRAL